MRRTQRGEVRGEIAIIGNNKVGPGFLGEGGGHFKCASFNAAIAKSGEDLEDGREGGHPSFIREREGVG